MEVEWIKCWNIVPCPNCCSKSCWVPQYYVFQKSLAFWPWDGWVSCTHTRPKTSHTASKAGLRAVIWGQRAGNSFFERKLMPNCLLRELLKDKKSSVEMKWILLSSHSSLNSFLWVSLHLAPHLTWGKLQTDVPPRTHLSAFLWSYLMYFSSGGRGRVKHSWGYNTLKTGKGGDGRKKNRNGETKSYGKDGGCWLWAISLQLSQLSG